jgi:1-acyl-sn-glycerol-3-phosphate acyltransferase
MDEACYRAANRLGRAAMRALRVETRTHGVEHLPTHGPVLMAATHVSYPDFLFLQEAALERARLVRFMCRHDVWRVPGVRTAMDRMRHVPVDREAPAGAYLAARRLLREGEAVCAFPEAGISYSYTVRALMRGVAGLARETGVPVVPVALWGSQRIWSVGRPDERGREPRPDLTRGRRVDVALGEPVTVAPGDDLTEWTRDLGRRLTSLLEGLQGLAHHQPRPGERASWHPAHLGGAAPTRLEARDLDSVPRSAVPPTWGPPTTAETTRRPPTGAHPSGAGATPASPAGW